MTSFGFGGRFGATRFGSSTIVVSGVANIITSASVTAIAANLVPGVANITTSASVTAIAANLVTGVASVTCHPSVIVDGNVHTIQSRAVFGGRFGASRFGSAIVMTTTNVVSASAVCSVHSTVTAVGINYKKAQAHFAGFSSLMATGEVVGTYVGSGGVLANGGCPYEVLSKYGRFDQMDFGF